MDHHDESGPMDHFVAVVIGTGVVGLAVARELAVHDLAVLVDSLLHQ
jgi:glycine/D-amino acid oxidase-like deaminating enzyme